MRASSTQHSPLAAQIQVNPYSDPLSNLLQSELMSFVILQAAPKGAREKKSKMNQIQTRPKGPS